MKTLALMFSFAFAFVASDQATYKYEFKVNGVSTIADAKVLSEAVAPIFDVAPDFNDDTDVLTVVSAVIVTEDKLREKLLHQGWILEEFKDRDHDSVPK